MIFRLVSHSFFTKAARNDWMPDSNYYIQQIPDIYLIANHASIQRAGVFCWPWRSTRSFTGFNDIQPSLLSLCLHIISDRNRRSVVIWESEERERFMYPKSSLNELRSPPGWRSSHWHDTAVFFFFFRDVRFTHCGFFAAWDYYPRFLFWTSGLIIS